MSLTDRLERSREEYKRIISQKEMVGATADYERGVLFGLTIALNRAEEAKHSDTDQTQNTGDSA